MFADVDMDMAAWTRGTAWVRLLWSGVLIQSCSEHARQLLVSCRRDDSLELDGSGFLLHEPARRFGSLPTGANGAMGMIRCSVLHFPDSPLSSLFSFFLSLFAQRFGGSYWSFCIYKTKRKHIRRPGFFWNFFSTFLNGRHRARNQIMNKTGISHFSSSLLYEGHVPCFKGNWHGCGSGPHRSLLSHCLDRLYDLLRSRY